MNLKPRSILYLIIAIPIVFLLVSDFVYHMAIQTTSLYQLHLPTNGSPYPAGNPGNTIDHLFGTAVADPYRWLEDGKSLEVIAWTQAQDKLTRAYLETLPGRDLLTKRFQELYYIDSIGAPVCRGNRYFYNRRMADQEKAILCMREGADGEEKVLIDPNTLSKNEPVSLGDWAPSYDGKKLAYALHPKNADEATLYVKDIATGAVNPNDVIEGAKYASPAWTPDGAGFYYTYLPPADSSHIAERPGTAEIRFHRLGENLKSDHLIHPRTGDPQTFLNVDLSRDGRWLFASISHGWTHNKIYFQDLHEAKPQWKPLITGHDALYDVTAWKDQFYILSNEGASHFRLFKTSALHPNRKDWKEIIAENPEAVLQNVLIVGERLVVTLLKNASNRAEMLTLDGSFIHEVPLPQLGSIGHMTGNPDQPDFYFGFSSFILPPTIYHANVLDEKTDIWSQVKLPIDPSPYVVEQVKYPSKDGTLVSMFLVHNKNMKRDGRTPFLLSGYGGFSVSMEPSFSSGLYPWLEAGGGFALPNLRGGGEYGEDWHRDGMLHKKQNTVDDFIAAAEYLVAQDYTRRDRLIIRGGSNGGLLIGAAITQRPELFRVAICAVPLLDMIRYPLFGSGRTWIPEYGSPDNENDFKALFAYSPYHHVKAGTEYPATLFLSSADDDRVDPMHARKMVAALQAANKSPYPVLLRIEKEAGHGGADQVKQAVESSVDSAAFMMDQVGIPPTAR